MKPQINMRHIEVFRSVMLSGSVVGALAHGLAAVPAFVTADLECQTIDAGYAVGEVLAIGPFYDSGGAAGMSVRKDATNLLVRFTSTGTVFATVHAGGGNGTFLTNANWKLRVRAYV